MGSQFPIRVGTQDPKVKVPNLNHWTIKEFFVVFFNMIHQGSPRPSSRLMNHRRTLKIQEWLHSRLLFITWISKGKTCMGQSPQETRLKISHSFPRGVTWGCCEFALNKMWQTVHVKCHQPRQFTWALVAGFCAGGHAALWSHVTNVSSSDPSPPEQK